MKKSIALFFASLVITQGLLAIEPVSTSSPASKFEFIIDLHTPRSNCTKYLGICKIGFCVVIDFSDNAPGSGQIPCSISINRNDELVIQLSEDNISKYDPGLLKYFEGRTTVSFDDTYDITEEVSKGLQPRGQVVIRPGTYPLSYQNGIYTLVFPL